MLHIYFGSQTGTAESFAYELADEAVQRGIASQVVDLQAFSPTTFVGHRCVVLLVANTGEGEPTDNAVDFHRWFMDPATPADSLTGVSFAVFGLGDRNYVHFNRMGELTDGGMERLGAKRLCSKGIGDDSGDIVLDFQAWKAEQLWVSWTQVFGISGDSHASDFAGVDQELLTIELAADSASLPREVPGEPADVLARFYFAAERVEVQRVTQLRQQAAFEEGLSTVLVELGCSGELVANHVAAGRLEILPENDPADVEAILPLLRTADGAANLDSWLTFVPTDSTSSSSSVKKPFPTPCTLREALTRYCDLHRPPSRRMLTALAPLLEPEVCGRIRKLLASHSAWQIVQDEAVAWTQLEFWSAVGAERLDLGAFLLHCPRQRARPYTVASSPRATQGQVHLCVSLVSRLAQSLALPIASLKASGVLPADASVSERGARWYGLCSSWLCSKRLAEGDTVLVHARPSVFKLVSEDVPLLMAAAGAGVAPFRAFWMELQAGRPRTARLALFFGCRHPDQDWLFRHEMEGGAVKTTATQHAPLTEVITAFSRLPRAGEGLYVQDRLKQQAQEVCEGFAAGGVLYICGSTRMGRGVLDTLNEILEGGKDQVQALQQEGRIVQELWGEPASAYNVQAVPEKDNDLGGVSDTLSPELLEAVKNGNHPAVERLIAARANVNFQADSRKFTRIGLRQEVGETPLHWAALRGDDWVAEQLLSAEADPDLRDQDGKVALHIAAFNGVANVTQRLLAARCDPDVQDLRGNTALQWVVLAGGSMRMLRLLLRFQASADLVNNEGESPAEVAEEQGLDPGAELLRAAMKR